MFRDIYCLILKRNASAPKICSPVFPNKFADFERFAPIKVDLSLFGRDFAY